MTQRAVLIDLPASELGRELPAADDAALRLVRLYSSGVLSGWLSPITRARAIARLGYDFSGEAHEQVMTFVALEDEAAGGWGRSRDHVEEAIVHARRGATAV